VDGDLGEVWETVLGAATGAGAADADWVAAEVADSCAADAGWSGLVTGRIDGPLGVDRAAPLVLRCASSDREVVLVVVDPGRPSEALRICVTPDAREIGPDQPTARAARTAIVARRALTVEPTTARGRRNNPRPHFVEGQIGPGPATRSGAYPCIGRSGDN
jgi:hypothetical protein